MIPPSHRITLALFVLVVAAAGCTRPRTWTTPMEKHLYYEVETRPETGRRLATTVEVHDSTVTVTVTEETLCTDIQYDVRRLSLRKEVRYPGKKYHLYLGSVILALGIPTLYLAARSEGTPRLIQFGVGTVLFVAPGSLLVGQGIWEKNHETTSVTRLGTTKKEIRRREYPCGSRPAPSKRVEVLTRTGYVSVGRTDETGRISFRKDRFEPLVRGSMRYIEVWVEGSKVHRIVLSGRARDEGKGNGS